MLNIGDKAPNFKALNQKNELIELRKLKFKKLILFFYPKDNTPTCTIEACNIRDHYSQLIDKGYTILGISPDNIKKHQNFIDKYQLPYDLLFDENHKIAEQYNLWVSKTLYGKAYMGIARTTFVLNSKKVIIKKIEKVIAKDHTSQILE